MVYKTISSREIINRIFRMFRPTDSNWIADAFETIGDGMKAMTVYPVYEKGLVVPEMKIKGHRAKLPCDLRFIDGVEYNGNRLPYGGDVTGYSLVNDKRTTNFSPQGDNEVEIFQAKTGTLDPLGTNIVKTSSSAVVEDGNYYQVNPDFIITSMENATIKLYYSGFPMDEDGLHLLPDQFDFIEALTWLVISHMILAGFKPSDPGIDYDFADKRWDRYKVQAMNTAMFPSVDKADSFYRMWVRAIPRTNLPRQFFMNSEVPERISLT